MGLLHYFSIFQESLSFIAYHLMSWKRKIYLFLCVCVWYIYPREEEERKRQRERERERDALFCCFRWFRQETGSGPSSHLGPNQKSGSTSSIFQVQLNFFFNLLSSKKAVILVSFFSLIINITRRFHRYGQYHMPIASHWTLQSDWWQLNLNFLQIKLFYCWWSCLQSLYDVQRRKLVISITFFWIIVSLSESQNLLGIGLWFLG